MIKSKSGFRAVIPVFFIHRPFCRQCWGSVRTQGFFWSLIALAAFLFMEVRYGKGEAFRDRAESFQLHVSYTRKAQRPGPEKSGGNSPTRIQENQLLNTWGVTDVFSVLRAARFSDDLTILIQKGYFAMSKYI